MASLADGQRPKKVTKPSWEEWKNFRREKSDPKISKRAICNHCEKEIQNQKTAAERHLTKCLKYIELTKPLGSKSSSSQQLLIE